VDHPTGAVPFDEGDASGKELPRLAIAATQQPDTLRVCQVAAQVAQGGREHGSGAVANPSAVLRARLELLDGLDGQAAPQQVSIRGLARETVYPDHFGGDVE